MPMSRWGEVAAASGKQDLRHERAAAQGGVHAGGNADHDSQQRGGEGELERRGQTFLDQRRHCAACRRLTPKSPCSALPTKVANCA